MFKSQERVCLATWFLTTCLALSLLISVVSGKLRDWFPGLGLHSLPQFLSKYPTDTAAPPVMMLISWVVVYSSRFLTQFIFYKLGSQMTPEKKIIYIMEITNTLFTIVWVCGVSYENVEVFIIPVTWKALTNWISLYQCCKIMEGPALEERHTPTAKPVPGHYTKVFKYCVIETKAFVAVWMTAALIWTMAQTLAYKSSYSRPDTELRGLVSAETGGTIGIACYVAILATWMYIDLVAHSAITRHTSCIYIFSSLFMLVLCFNNYNWNKGISLNNVLLIVLSIISRLVSKHRRTLWMLAGNLNGTKKRY